MLPSNCCQYFPGFPERNAGKVNNIASRAACRLLAQVLPVQLPELQAPSIIINYLERKHQRQPFCRRQHAPLSRVQQPLCLTFTLGARFNHGRQLVEIYHLTNAILSLLHIPRHTWERTKPVCLTTLWSSHRSLTG